MRKIRSFLYAILAIALLPVVQSCGSSESCETSSSSSVTDKFDLIPVQLSENGKWSMMNAQGEVVYEDEFDERPYFARNGLFSVKKGDGYSVYRIGGKTPEPVEGLENLKSVGVMSDEGLMPVSFFGKGISLVDKSGKIKFELEPIDGDSIIDCSSEFTDGLLLCHTYERKSCFVNTNGEVAIKFDFKKIIEPFSDGLALIRGIEDGKLWYWGINTKGEKMFQLNDKFLGDPYIWHGYVFATDDDMKQRYIYDKQGNETKLPSEINHIRDFNGKYIIFTDEDGQDGIANVKGEILIKPSFYVIGFGNNDKIFAKENKRDHSFIQITADGKKVGKPIDVDFLQPSGKFGYFTRDNGKFVLLDNNFKRKSKEEFYDVGVDFMEWSKWVVGDNFTPMSDEQREEELWKKMEEEMMKEVEELEPEEEPEPVIVDEENKVIEKVEQMPQYPGGEDALMKFVSENIVYPENAKKNKIQGWVTVMFVVKKDGSIGQVRVARGKDPDLDKEAVRVVKTLKGFYPGKMNCKPVNTWYTLPIKFRLPQ